MLSVMKNKGVLTLDISENTIKKNSAEILGKFLSSSTSFERIILEKMHVTDSIIGNILQGYFLGIVDSKEEEIVNHNKLLSPIKIEKQSEKQNVTSIELENNITNLSTFYDMASSNKLPVNISDRLKICSLESLSLSSNKITDRGAIVISSALKYMNLIELDLSWNQIMNQGASAIATELNNCKLASLDLSWNSIGSKYDHNRTAAKQFSKMFTSNKTLTHIDLSQNHLDEADCTEIGNGLKSNHTLLGLHISGNKGTVDNYGNLAADSEPWPLEASHCITRIIGTRVEGKEAWTKRNNCWICGMWKETHLTYQSITADKTAVRKLFDSQRNYADLYIGNIVVKIHASFDNWKPEIMKISK